MELEKEEKMRVGMKGERKVRAIGGYKWNKRKKDYRRMEEDRNGDMQQRG